jgi:hypothetical protein
MYQKGAYMQKTHFLLLMLIASFSSSHLKGAEKRALQATKKEPLLSQNFLPKGSDFKKVTERGKLIFRFSTTTTGRATPAGALFFRNNTPSPTPDATPDATPFSVATSQIFYRVIIRTPDKKEIRGPKINFNNPPAEFTIIVPPSILYGTYTIVVKNISIPEEEQIDSIISPLVIVQNSLNRNIAFTSVQGSAPNPGDSYEGEFVPTSIFFHGDK